MKSFRETGGKVFRRIPALVTQLHLLYKKKTTVTGTQRKRNNIIHTNLEENIGNGCLNEEDKQRKTVFHTMAKAGLGFAISSRTVRWLTKAEKHTTRL